MVRHLPSIRTVTSRRTRCRRRLLTSTHRRPLLLEQLHQHASQDLHHSSTLSSNTGFRISVSTKRPMSSWQSSMLRGYLNQAPKSSTSSTASAHLSVSSSTAYHKPNGHLSFFALLQSILTGFHQPSGVTYIWLWVSMGWRK